MNIKRIFGTMLTLLGVAGLIITAVLFVNDSSGDHKIKTMLTYSVLSLLFFVSGISLVRTIKDEV